MDPVRLNLGTRWPGFFGSPERRLFGCLHPPRDDVKREVSTVLCYPLGQEYAYSHRAFLHLASRLANEGFSVGRFDYFGTGDSAGDDDDASLSGWVDDISTVIEETRRVVQRRHLGLIGLRFGAALAMETAVKRGDVLHLVLWDPIVNGSEYFEQMKVLHQERLWGHFFQRPTVEQSNERPTELLGLKMNDHLIDELIALDLLSIETKPARSVLIIDSRGDAAVERLRDHLQSLEVEVTYEHIPGFSIWTEDPDKGLVPNQALQSIVNWMSSQNQ
ncbi:MAG: alpha/beta hydrolase [Chloroflexota bacterium]